MSFVLVTRLGRMHTGVWPACEEPVTGWGRKLERQMTSTGYPPVSTVVGGSFHRLVPNLCTQGDGDR